MLHCFSLLIVFRMLFFQAQRLEEGLIFHYPVCDSLAQIIRANVVCKDKGVGIKQPGAEI